jgi:hypothetical protein
VTKFPKANIDFCLKMIPYLLEVNELSGRRAIYTRKAGWSAGAAPAAGAQLVAARRSLT